MIEASPSKLYAADPDALIPISEPRTFDHVTVVMLDEAVASMDTATLLALELGRRVGLGDLASIAAADQLTAAIMERRTL